MPTSVIVTHVVLVWPSKRVRLSSARVQASASTASLWCFVLFVLLVLQYIELNGSTANCKRLTDKEQHSNSIVRGSVAKAQRKQGGRKDPFKSTDKATWNDLGR